MPKLWLFWQEEVFCCNLGILFYKVEYFFEIYLHFLSIHLGSIQGHEHNCIFQVWERLRRYPKLLCGIALQSPHEALLYGLVLLILNRYLFNTFHYLPSWHLFRPYHQPFPDYGCRERNTRFMREENCVCMGSPNYSVGSLWVNVARFSMGHKQNYNHKTSEILKCQGSANIL